MSNAPRVTQETIDKLMETVLFKVEHAAGTTTTFVHAFLEGTFYLATGQSACVSLENFDPEIGQQIAYNKARSQARDKLWELEGYALYKQINHVIDTIKEEEMEVTEVHLGDRVYFYEQVGDQISEPMVAIVAGVRNPEEVALTVLAPNGTTHARMNVILLGKFTEASPNLKQFARPI